MTTVVLNPEARRVLGHAVPRQPSGFERGALALAVLVVVGLLFLPTVGPDRASAAGVTQLVVLAKGRERLRAGEAPAVRFVVPNPQAMPAELDAARRREAVEALAASEEPGRHLNILLAVLKQDEDSDVREAALDAL